MSSLARDLDIPREVINKIKDNANIIAFFKSPHPFS